MKKRLLYILLALSMTAFSLCGCEDFDYEDFEYEDSGYEDPDYDDPDNESADRGSKKGFIDQVEAEIGNKIGRNNREKEAYLSDVEPAKTADDAESATILIYMNGSDLETKAGLGSVDIAEMLDSGIGDNVNVILQTMGTRKWHDYGISSKTSQIHQVKNGELILLEDDLGQLDCTDYRTLSDFIDYGKTNYPADRYMLIFWDHGGGPVYGFGYDEWQDEDASLTLDEIQKALRKNDDISFDIIGMDCCIMANLETCYVLSPFCKYAILSEDFESELGWLYTEWMRTFEKNPGMSTPLLGKKIIDGMIEANENDYYSGDTATMILVNESAVPDLMNRWTEYAYKNSEELLGSNYSKLHKARGRGIIDDLLDAWGDDDSYVTMDDYYVSDVMSIVENIGSEGESTDNLKSSLKDCVAYFGHTSDKNELTGLAVSLPYGDRSYYNKLVDVYSECGIDKDYIDWLEGFVSAHGSDDYCDYSDFEESWCGWETYEEGWSSCVGEEDSEDWEYDYEEEIWYLIEDGNVYFYDDETDMMFFYDEYEDEIYYYDEEDDDWYILED
ncbi:MAG: hypothetical protein K5886_05960 [Lachnospiraceae bacterium]|nr:hypothetical protein [Lachnospiraceae bacterium]